MGLVVDVVLSQTTGTAETEAALTMLERVPTARRITSGPTRGTTRGVRDDLPLVPITPHVAMKQRHSAWTGGRAVTRGTRQTSGCGSGLRRCSAG